MSQAAVATPQSPADESGESDLRAVVVPLLKGVLYQDSDGKGWNSLLSLKARVRDYVDVLGLELVLDEAEGYAFLRAPRYDEDDPRHKLPRLVARRPLSFHVSLLLALLRKKLAEFDAGGAETRLVLQRGDIVELIRVFLPDSTNEARLVDQVDTHINRVCELGFLRRLKTQSGEEPTFEVRRILKAFVDAQLLSDLDTKLGEYRDRLAAESDGG